MKRILQWFILIVGCILIVQLVRSTVDLMQRGTVVDEARAKLEQEKKEHEELTEKLRQTEEPGFIEQQARDKLNMARKGEVVVIAPPVTPEVSTPSATLEVPNWKQWLIAFRFIK